MIMIIWMLISVISLVCAGMHLSLILVNRQDGKPIDVWQYAWLVILFLNGLYFYITTIGHANHFNLT